MRTTPKSILRITTLVIATALTAAVAWANAATLTAEALTAEALTAEALTVQTNTVETHTDQWDYEPALLSVIVDPNKSRNTPHPDQGFLSVTESCLDGSFTDRGCEPIDEYELQGIANGYHTVCTVKPNETKYTCYRVQLNAPKLETPHVDESASTPQGLFEDSDANPAVDSQPAAVLSEENDYELQGPTCPSTTGDPYHAWTYAPDSSDRFCLPYNLLTRNVSSGHQASACGTAFVLAQYTPTGLTVCADRERLQSQSSRSGWALSAEDPEQSGQSRAFDDPNDCVIPVRTVTDWNTTSPRLNCEPAPAIVANLSPGNGDDPYIADREQNAVASYAVTVPEDETVALQLCWLMHPDEVQGAGESCDRAKSPAADLETPMGQVLPALGNPTAAPAGPLPIPGHGTVIIAVNEIASPAQVGVVNGASVVTFEGFAPGIHTVQLTFNHPDERVVAQTMLVHVMVPETTVDPAGTPALRLSLGVALGIAVLCALWLMFGARVRPGAR